MPNFENIDQYEARNPKSGNKEIIPIAPHSLQASDYRPRKRGSSEVKAKEKVPAFPEVEIEPVSIQQMEKEYRQAGRQINRRTRQSRGSQSLWQRLSKWLKSLLRSDKDTARKPRPHPGKHRSQRPRAASPKSGGKRPPQGKGDGRESRDQNRNQRRRRRPRGKGPQEGGQAPHGGGQQGKAPDKGSDQGGPPKKRSRNRRNRNRRGPRGGQKGNPNSGNSQ